MEIDEGPRLRFAGTLRLANPPRLWALVQGGRQLPPLVAQRNFLLDSNAVSYLIAHDRMLEPDKGWWKVILESEDTILNPAPSAFEGNTGAREPTREEFELRFHEDVAALRELFPKVQVIEYDDMAFEGVYGMVHVIAEANLRENAFLLAAAPSVVEPVSTRLRRTTEEVIIRIAAENGLRHDSFALFGILSVLYSSGTGVQIARNILKPAMIVRNGNAYNPLQDLSLLRMLTANIAYFSNIPEGPFALLTGDRYLAAFWCTLDVKNFKVNADGHAEAIFSFSQPLFPTLNENERHELSERVALIGRW